MSKEKDEQKEEVDDNTIDNVSEEHVDLNLENNEVDIETAEHPQNEEEDNTDSNADDESDSTVAAPTYEELLSEVEALKDQLLRSLAESENIRRRLEREKADVSKYAVTNFARQIISVTDNLTRALSSIEPESIDQNEELKNLFVGIEMTDKELTNTFEQFHIKSIDAIGQKFDHNIHQAMFEVEDADQPAGLVVQEVQKGYMLHDRLLRPAMVGVSKGGPKLEVSGELNSQIDSTKEKEANDSSSAYEKQSEVANKAAEGNNTQLDKEL